MFLVVQTGIAEMKIILQQTGGTGYCAKKKILI